MTVATLYSSTTQLCGRDISRPRCLLYSSFICSLIHVQLCTKYGIFCLLNQVFSRVCNFRVHVWVLCYANELMGISNGHNALCIHP